MKYKIKYINFAFISTFVKVEFLGKSRTDMHNINIAELPRISAIRVGSDYSVLVAYPATTACNRRRMKDSPTIAVYRISVCVFISIKTRIALENLDGFPRNKYHRTPQNCSYQDG